MNDFKIVFDGENGIDKLFNEARRHTQDDALKLIPFTTTKDKTGFNDFKGVTGAFSRLLSDKSLKQNFKIEQFNESLDKLVVCSSKEKATIHDIVEVLIIKNGELVPFNIKSMNYINSNNDNEKIAQFLYTMFISKYEKEAFKDAYESETVNVLQKLVFDSLPKLKSKNNDNLEMYICFLSYVKESFQKDICFLLRNNMYENNIKRILEYYFMFYISQLAVKLSKFENGKADEVEKIYMTLSWEVTSKTRQAYEYGWKYVKEHISKLFSHAVTLELISHNNLELQMDYIQANKYFYNNEDDSIVKSIKTVIKKYKEWIPNVGYTLCKHDECKDGECLSSNEIRSLYETIDYQFNNGSRKAAYGRYSARFVEFVQTNFGKRRGVLGYTFNITEQDIILFTQIVLGESDGRIRLINLFTEFEKRGLIFDRDSKKKIVELYEKLNLLEKKSDSGDAQYVRTIL